MARAVIPSLQRLVFYLIITLVLTIAILYFFHEFIATPISLSKLIEESVNVIIGLSACVDGLNNYSTFQTVYDSTDGSIKPQQ